MYGEATADVDLTQKQCIYSVGKQSLPISETIKEKIAYYRSQPVANSSYGIECETTDKTILAILAEIVLTRTGKPCDQKSVVIRFVYKDELNDLSLEAVVTHLCASSTGRYSLHGAFRQVKEDV